MTQTYGHIVITGASSGIGEALALHYAAPGIMLSLGGRDETRLRDVAERCEEKGVNVNPALVDVTDRAAMEEWLRKADQKKPVDLVIANAGISAGTGGLEDGETPEQARRIFGVNLGGVLNTIDSLLPLMKQRGSGQIAIMSSLAGFRGWPGAPAYCASKAAVKVYGESLRGSLAPLGIKVNVICPGFVESRMTAVNDFPMPFLMSADKAARIIAKNLARDRGRICFPLRAFWIAWFFAAMPDAFVQPILRRMPEKGSAE